MMKILIGKKFEKSILQCYEVYLMHAKDFMQLEYNVTDMPVVQINFAYLVEFEYYLSNVRNCGNNTAIEYIKNLGKIVGICLGNGWLPVNPYLTINLNKMLYTVDSHQDELCRIKK